MTRWTVSCISPATSAPSRGRRGLRGAPRPGFGRFICPTGKDNRIDDENLELLSRGLVKLAAAYQIKK